MNARLSEQVKQMQDKSESNLQVLMEMEKRLSGNLEQVQSRLDTHLANHANLMVDLAKDIVPPTVFPAIQQLIQALNSSATSQQPLPPAITPDAGTQPALPPDTQHQPASTGVWPQP
jgi:uncharacterized membrane-anchored protein YhcB (DUF1043 family)